MKTQHMKELPLTRELFTKTLNFIQEQWDVTRKINELFTEAFEDSVFYPYFKYEAVLVKVLAAAMQDKEEWIEYFIYELNMGKEYQPGNITVNGENIKLATIDDLYDLLVKEASK